MKKRILKKQIWGISWTKKRIWNKQTWEKSWTKKRTWKKQMWEKIWNKYDKNPEPKKENCKKVHKNNKKCLNKVKKICQKIRLTPYFICVVSYRCLYKRSVKLFEHEKYILTREVYCPVRSFDEKRTYAVHVKNRFLEMKCHVKQSSIKWV